MGSFMVGRGFVGSFRRAFGVLMARTMWATPEHRPFRPGQGVGLLTKRENTSRTVDRSTGVARARSFDRLYSFTVRRFFPARVDPFALIVL